MKMFTKLKQKIKDIDEEADKEWQRKNDHKDGIDRCKNCGLDGNHRFARLETSTKHPQKTGDIITIIIDYTCEHCNNKKHTRIITSSFVKVENVEY